jgi:LysR family transcriptional regulator, positive regulator for ilvC
VDHMELRVFVSLSNTLHFGRSGQECNLSASAVSRTISRLEEELGRRLFDRDKRSVELRPEGFAFRQYAIEAIGAWDRIRASLAEGGEALKGEIHIYSSVAASYSVLDRLFPVFRQKYPAVHVRLRTGDSADALKRIQDGSADIAVAALPGSLPGNVLFRGVAVTPLLFVSPASECEAAVLCGRSPVPWARVPMILTETGLSRKRADAWFRAAGVKPNVYAEVSGHEAVISMVRLGCGAGIVPRLVLDRFAQEGEVRVIPVKRNLEPYEVGLCALKRRLQSPVVKAFWDIAGTGKE